MDQLFFVLGSASAGIAVALGAFGAHALKARLSPDMLAVYETGVRYQPIGGLAWLSGLAQAPTLQENSCLTTSNSASATIQQAKHSSSRHSNRSA